jgi:CDP-diacylglycerol--glycerol-3-phosphate 3-phosphatidyltransferase
MKTINKNLPNIITIIRIFLTPIVIALFLIPSNGILKFIAFGVYVIASSTDFIDGYIARKYNLVSDIGKLLDAAADKFLQTTVLILVLTTGYNVVSEWINLVLILVILLRDSWMSTIRQLCASRGTIIAADIWGKIKSILMDLSMGILFFYIALAEFLPNGTQTLLFADVKLGYIGCVGLVLLAISAVFSVMSCINYTKSAWGTIIGKVGTDSQNNN